MMKKVLSKINMFLPVVTLIVTAALLILTVYSWYITNDTAKVNQVSGMVESTDYDFNLQVYSTSDIISDLGGDGYGEIIPSGWVDIDKFGTLDQATKDLWPNGYILFRVVLADTAEVEGDIEIEVSIQEVLTALDTEKVKVNPLGTSILYDGTPVYDVVNDKVTVNEDGVNKTLYNVDGDKVSLGDYLLESAVMVDTKPVYTKRGYTSVAAKDYYEGVDLEGYKETPITGVLSDDAEKYVPLQNAKISGVVSNEKNNTKAVHFALYYEDGYFKQETISSFEEGVRYYKYNMQNGYRRVSSSETYNRNTNYYTKTEGSDIINYYQFQILSIKKFFIQVAA